MNKVQCLCGCKEWFEVSDMHKTRSHVKQLSKVCNAKARKKHRAEVKRHQQETLRLRLEAQKEEREAKRKSQFENLEINPLRNSIGKQNKMIKVDHALLDIELKRIERGYQL